MTRKRFVKLLMARGFYRNEATAMATEAKLTGMPYAVVYASIEAEDDAMEKIMEAAAVIYKAVEKATNAICAGIRAFSEAFVAAMANE